MSHLCAQNEMQTIDTIAFSSCTCINEIRDTVNFESKIATCIEGAYQQNEQQLLNIYSAFVKNNPNKSQVDANKYIQKEVVKVLSETCTTFYDFVIQKTEKITNLVTTNTESEYIKKSAFAICKCVEDLNEITTEKVDKCLVKSVDISSKEFQDELSKNLDLANDIVAYLMGTCKSYSTFFVLQKIK